MCGIIAFTGEDERLGSTLADLIRHRGPDDIGVSADGGVTLANRRLAILDLSSAGHMPMRSANGTALITYNGEIYNSPDLRQELSRMGVMFRGHSDTEVILEGYRRWGTEIFDRLRGMWGLVILDASAKKLIVSRDPFGIKPLFLWRGGGHIAVASEIKVLASLAQRWGMRLRPFRRGIETYHVLGYVPHPDTVYEHVSQAAPGTVMEFDIPSGRLLQEHTVTYHDGPPQYDDPVSAFGDTLREGVKAHLLSDVPVGVFLSGGADSTSIALSVQSLGQRMRAFTVNIPGRADAPYAEKIAAYAGLEHEVILFDQAAFDRAYRTCWEMLDEPIADSSLLPSLAVAEAASRHVKVVLTGEGGDELFLGYPRYGLLAGLHSVRSPDTIMKVLDAMRWGRPFMRRARLAYDRFIRRDVWATYLESAAVDQNTQSHLALLERGAKYFMDVNDDIAAFDRRWYLPNDLLYKTDFATMAHSIEGRVPFLDRRMYAFSCSLPGAWRWGGVGKRVIRDFLKQHLPAELVMRGKSGFSVPLARYLTGYGQDIRDAYATSRDILRSVGLPNDVQTRCADDPTFRDRWTKKFRHFTFLTLALAKTLPKFVAD